MSIQERIQMILKMHHLTPSAFADKIGVQRSSISHVLSGRNKPGLDFLEKILLHFPRVNAHWLITGKVSEGKSLQTEERSSALHSINKSQEVQENTESNDKKEIEKILIIYRDGTFKEYQPNAK